MPICCRRNRASPVSLSRSIRCPATVTVPLLGRSRPAMRLSRVDLPLPDGPITATASPGAMSRRTSVSAGWPSSSYRLVTSLSWMSGSAGGAAAPPAPAQPEVMSAFMGLPPVMVP